MNENCERGVYNGCETYNQMDKKEKYENFYEMGKVPFNSSAHIFAKSTNLFSITLLSSEFICLVEMRPTFYYDVVMPYYRNVIMKLRIMSTFEW